MMAVALYLVHFVQTISRSLSIHLSMIYKAQRRMLEGARHSLLILVVCKYNKDNHIAIVNHA